MENFKLEDFQEATKVIREFIPRFPIKKTGKIEILRTALHKSASLSNLLSAKIYLKLENQNVTGSFKIRGAMYSVKTLKNIYEEFMKGSILPKRQTFSITENSLKSLFKRKIYPKKNRKLWKSRSCMRLGVF